MEYTIPEINNGVAKVQWSDGSWTFVELVADMTEAELDDLVFRITPPYLKTGSTPSFLEAGATRTASEMDAPVFTDDRPAWQKARQEAYGSSVDQIEYITENGLEAWQAKVAQIKANNPKPEE